MTFERALALFVIVFVAGQIVGWVGRAHHERMLRRDKRRRLRAEQQAEHARLELVEEPA